MFFVYCHLKQQFRVPSPLRPFRHLSIIQGCCRIIVTMLKNPAFHFHASQVQFYFLNV